MAEKTKPNILPFMLITTVALPLLVSGIISYTNPELMPWASNPSITWSLIGVGLLMDMVAAWILVVEIQRVNRINSNSGSS